MSDEGQIRDEAELLLYALLDILPMRGSWTTGYEPEETCSPTVTATGEEWGTAAHHACELHKLLRDSAARTSGTDEPRIRGGVCLDCGSAVHHGEHLRDDLAPCFGNARQDISGSGTDEPRWNALLESIENLRGHRANGQESYLAHVDSVFRQACELARSGTDEVDAVLDAAEPDLGAIPEFVRDRIRSRMEGL